MTPRSHTKESRPAFVRRPFRLMDKDLIQPENPSSLSPCHTVRKMPLFALNQVDDSKQRQEHRRGGLLRLLFLEKRDRGKSFAGSSPLFAKVNASDSVRVLSQTTPIIKPDKMQASF